MGTQLRSQVVKLRTLVIVEHEEALKGYRLGRMWLLGKEWEGSTPGTNYLINNLKMQKGMKKKPQKFLFML